MNKINVKSIAFDILMEKLSSEEYKKYKNKCMVYIENAQHKINMLEDVFSRVERENMYLYHKKDINTNIDNSGLPLELKAYLKNVIKAIINSNLQIYYIINVNTLEICSNNSYALQVALNKLARIKKTNTMKGNEYLNNLTIIVDRRQYMNLQYNKYYELKMKGKRIMEMFDTATDTVNDTTYDSLINMNLQYNKYYELKMKGKRIMEMFDTATDTVNDTTYDSLIKEIQDTGSKDIKGVDKKIIKCMEELGELSEGYLKLTDYKYNTDSKEEVLNNLRGEVADLFIMVTLIGNELNINNNDLKTEISNKIIKWKNKIELNKIRIANDNLQ